MYLLEHELNQPMTVITSDYDNEGEVIYFPVATITAIRVEKSYCFENYHNVHGRLVTGEYSCEPIISFEQGFWINIGCVSDQKFHVSGQQLEQEYRDTYQAIAPYVQK